METTEQSSGQNNLALLEAFKAQGAPAQANFLKTMRSKNCAEILTAPAIAPERRTAAIYGQIHIVELDFFSNEVLKAIDRERRLAENRALLSSNKSAMVAGAVDAVINQSPEALEARQRAVAWLRGILPEELQAGFDDESRMAVGDIAAKIEILRAQAEQQPEERRRLVGTMAIAS